MACASRTESAMQGKLRSVCTIRSYASHYWTCTVCGSGNHKMWDKCKSEFKQTTKGGVVVLMTQKDKDECVKTVPHECSGVRPVEMANGDPYHMSIPESYLHPGHTSKHRPLNSFQYLLHCPYCTDGVKSIWSARESPLMRLHFQVMHPLYDYPF